MLRSVGEKMWLAESGAPGATLAISFGVHGNERPPIDAGLALLRELEAGKLALAAGRLLLIHSNPRASEQDQRWSEGGVDLNRCFSSAIQGRAPELYEEGRAGEIAAVLEEYAPEALVDFHCTVEPGEPFMMQHPGVDHVPSQAVLRLLSASVLLSDPELNFGNVSLDEWMGTRGKVGICFETGWIHSPDCTPEFVLGEMKNLLAGHGMLAGVAPRVHDDKTLLQLDHVIRCEGEGFAWRDGIGQNLQALAQGTVLGAYSDGREVSLPVDATLIFPKKKPELVQQGKPLVYLGVTH
jgi:predicted deacylase